MSVSNLSQSVFGAGLLACAVIAAAGDAAAQPAPATPARQATTPDPVQSGTATVLRGGQPIALGLILANDGRVLTTRSALAGGRKNLTLRFADGSSVAATVGHEDAGRDLALLVPARLAWTQGLPAATRAPAEGTPLEMLELKQNRAQRRPVRAKGAISSPAVDLELTPPFLAGSPVVAPGAGAIGIVVLSCDPPTPGAPCKPRPRLATVPAVREFLRNVPPTAAIQTGWLGVRGERAVGTHARGVRVVEVTPGSPAAAAGLQAGPAGDLVLAVGGAPVTTEDELTRALARHAPGEKVAVTIFSRGAYRSLDLVLGRPPAGGAPAPAAAPARPAPAGSRTDGAPKDFGSSR